MMAVSSMLRTWKVSAMTGPPFCHHHMVPDACRLQFRQHSDHQPSASRHLLQPAASDLFALNMEQFWRAAFAGVSQVFLINNVITGILFLIGLR